MAALSAQSQCAVYRGGRIVLEGEVDWPEGTELLVSPVASTRRPPSGTSQPVIIAGFGLAGRYVADLLQNAGIPFTVIERNAVTVATQRALGREIVFGDVTSAETLEKAGLREAGLLALTIPDEDEVLKGIALARRLRPDIYIIARTNYSSKGMQASQLGADDVVKAEQAVALQFYECLNQHLAHVGEK